LIGFFHIDSQTKRKAGSAYKKRATSKEHIAVCSQCIDLENLFSIKDPFKVTKRATKLAL